MMTVKFVLVFSTALVLSFQGGGVACIKGMEIAMYFDVHQVKKVRTSPKMQVGSYAK